MLYETVCTCTISLTGNSNAPNLYAMDFDWTSTAMTSISNEESIDSKRRLFWAAAYLILRFVKSHEAESIKKRTRREGSYSHSVEGNPMALPASHGAVGRLLSAPTEALGATDSPWGRARREILVPPPAQGCPGSTPHAAKKIRRTRVDDEVSQWVQLD